MTDSLLDSTHFKYFNHQIAGHGLNDTNTGFLQLRTTDRYVYKPTSNTEHQFYTSAHTPHSPLNCLQPFVADYYGIQHIHFPQPDITKPYLQLRNVLHPYTQPNICDIKIGQHTFIKHAPPYKVNAENAKFPYQSLLGFRITGMKVYDTALSQYRYYNKFFGRAVQPDSVTNSLNQYFDGGVCDQQHAVYIRSVLCNFVKQLQQLLLIFQTDLQHFEFVSSSLLLVYDSDPNSGVEPRVYMIDFCHYSQLDGNVVHDQNYMYGLNSLITLLQSMVQLYDKQVSNHSSIDISAQLTTRPLPMQYITLVDADKRTPLDKNAPQHKPTTPIAHINGVT